VSVNVIRRRKQGQSTVEFALILPLAVACMVFVLTAGLVVYDHLALADFSRSAVRTAVTSNDPASAATQFVKVIDTDIRVKTVVNAENGLVQVRLERTRSFPLLFVARALPKFTVHASAVMMQEPPHVIGEGFVIEESLE
jgi:Flp pilus assembly protein TadG